MTRFDRLTKNSPLSPFSSSIARCASLPGWAQTTALAAVLLGLLALSLLLTAVPAGATTFVPMTDAALADQAPLIVAGEITASDPAPVNGRPATDYTVSLTRVLKGAAPADPLTVRVPGGVDASGALYRVWGAPRFLPGDQVILFLGARGDGTLGVSQLLLGAFIQTRQGGQTLAVRDLSDAVAVSPVGVASKDATDRARDFDGFGDWLAARAAGDDEPVDYFVDGVPAGAGLSERYTLLESGGKNFRWFNGGGTWFAYQGGVAGMSSGGFAEVQRALSAWNADPGSSLSLQYGGTTSRTGGFSSSDGANVVLFEDPNDEIPGSFDCGSGGVLAIGGFSKVSGTADFGGATYWRIVEGEVVTQDGAGCFFAGNNGKNGELVFAHEIGHALGLGHSCGDSGTPSCADPVLNDALMRAYAHNDGRGARLGADDRAALAVLYGDGVPACTVPTAPSGLTATASTSSRIDLTWQDRSEDEEGFAIERKLSGASSFTRVATLPANARSYSDTGLAESTGYTYQVRATGCDGESAAAGPASAQTPAAPSDPPPGPTDPPPDPDPGPTDPPPDPSPDPPPAGAPHDLQVDVLSQSQVRLAWSWDGTAPSTFRVELRSGVLFVEVETIPGTTTQTTLTGLRPKTGYSFRVRARTASGFSPYSEVVSARTDPQAAGDPGALSAAEVACDGGRLQGLLDRLTVEAPNLASGRGTGINLSFTASGDFAGLAFTEPKGSKPEHELAFSTNPEETTLLRNPARPQLSSVSLTRNDLSSDLVEGQSSDRLRVTIDPTLTPGNSAASNLLAIDNLAGSVDGATSAKPGRGLAALLDTCHGELGADDVHVFRVLSKVLRVHASAASHFEVAIYRGEASGTYRVDAYGYDGHGRSMGRVSAELSVTWTQGGALDQGMLRVLPACGGGGGAPCTSFDAAAQIALTPPTYLGQSADAAAVQVSFAPATSEPQSEEAVDWSSLLASSTWLRPPAGAERSTANASVGSGTGAAARDGLDALTASQVSCDGTRLAGVLDRLRVVAPNAPGRGVNLSYTASGDFAGIAYTAGAAGGERQLAFSTNPEETTLLRNPTRPQLFSVSVSRNGLNSDLVSGGAGLLRVVLDPTLGGGGADTALLRVDNRTGDASNPADAKPGRGLADLVAPCHTRFAAPDVHLFRVLSKLVRAQAPGATVSEIAIYKGPAQDSYRIDAYPITADGRKLGRMAAELTVTYTASGQLRTGTLRTLPRCTGSVTDGCTNIATKTELFLVQPTSSGADRPAAGARVVSTGAPSQASISFVTLLDGTSWRQGL